MMSSQDRPDPRSAPARAAEQRGGLRSWCFGTWCVLWLAASMLLVPHNLDPAMTDWGRFSFFDYRDTVWYPMKDFADGAVPWDTVPYLSRHPGIQYYPLYVPSYWWLCWPLVMVSYPVSVTWWIGIIAGALIYLVTLCFRCFLPDILRRWPWFIALTVGVICLTRPARTALFQGQWALLCAAGAVVALLAEAQERRAFGGTLLSIVKPPVGLPLLAVQAVTGRLRLALRAWLLTAALILPFFVIVVLRLGSLDATLAVAVDSLTSESAADSVPTFTYIDARGTLGHLMGSPSPALQLLAIAGAAALTLVPAAVAWRRLGPRNCWYVSCACLAMELITPTMLYAHIITWPAIFALVARLKTGWRSRDLRQWALPAAVTLLLLVPHVVPEGVFSLVGLSEREANAANGLAILLAAGGAVAGLVVDLRRQSSPRTN